MLRKSIACLRVCLGLLVMSTAYGQAESHRSATLILRSPALATSSGPAGRALRIDDLFFETSKGRVTLPPHFTGDVARSRWSSKWKMDDGRVVDIRVTPRGRNFMIELSAKPDTDIVKWGLAVDAGENEYYSGLMERVVDGPQAASWAPGITPAMNLRGQRVEMLVKPTTSIYAPFYLSSRGYAVFVQGTWPGYFDFAVADPKAVKIEFEGPSLRMRIYTATDPATLVRQHALDAGPPFLPPKWIFTPWRWRDEHTQRAKYYDGTPVTGPFNSEIMEDVLMMKAFGIPNGVYWIDRPWGPGLPWGYDDFEIDEQRLPHFAEMVKWLNAQDTQMLLWIAPFFQGQMEKEATAKGYTLAGQKRPANGNNFPMVDLSNPAAKEYWKNGVAKLLKLGVAAFKLDRGEENIPDDGPFKLFDGRSIRENRNAYVAMYVKATHEIASKIRGNDFVLMPRGAYTGSSQYGVFWGGDVGGTQEGLRDRLLVPKTSEEACRIRRFRGRKGSPVRGYE